MSDEHADYTLLLYIIIHVIKKCFPTVKTTQFNANIIHVNINLKVK